MSKREVYEIANAASRYNESCGVASVGGLLLIGGILVVFWWVVNAFCSIVLGIGEDVGDASCPFRRDGRDSFDS